MRLSQTARYAIRTVVELARQPDRRVSADELSEALEFPRNYLSKTLHALGEEEILEGKRGPGGGYRLAVDPEELSLDTVIAPFERLEAERECVLGLPECSEVDPCPMHETWRQMTDRLRSFFRRTTVADVLEASRRGEGTRFQIPGRNSETSRAS